tara:strand:- start:1 stop:192 length:192 start_codon:yes stop_codon:yes gene_type:complete
MNKNKTPGDDLFSHTLASAVSWALWRFTSVFGKVTGGATTLLPPGDKILLVAGAGFEPATFGL